MLSRVQRVVERLPVRATLGEAKEALGSLWSPQLWSTLKKDVRMRVAREDLLAALPQADALRVRGGVVPAVAAAAAHDDSLAGAGGGVGAGASAPVSDSTDSTDSEDEVERRGTDWLLRDIGGSERLVSMCERFYRHAFADVTLDAFILSHGDPHGERLGTWIAERMGGEGPLWTAKRGSRARFTAHRRAWNSHKREPSKRGQRFKLDDCRIWMRLMFWAARDEGLADHKAFWRWYVPFIGRFSGIYAWNSPPYAAEDAAWSADPANIAKYKAQGHSMDDVLGQR